jgi:3-dehydroquinate synthetase
VYAAAVSRDLSLEFAAAPVRSRVRIARGSLARLGAFARGTLTARHVVLVSDARVGRLYAATARRSLARAGFAVDQVELPAGEAAKRPAVLGGRLGSVRPHRPGARRRRGRPGRRA